MDLRQRVLAAVNKGRLVQRLQRMIQFKSYSNTPGEGELASWLMQHLKSLGLEVTHQEVAPGRPNTLALMRGRGGGSSLMFNGHIDTNMVGLGWTKDPWGGVVDDEFVYGIGVSNMKAGDAAMIEAVCAVQDAGARVAGDVCIALVVGELQGGIGTKHLINSGVRTDYFIVTEPTDVAILSMHPASFEFFVHTIGITRHMSKADEGVNAIEKMYGVMNQLKRTKFTGTNRPEFLSMQRINIGSIRGGMGKEYLTWRAPQVPDYCTIRCAGRHSPDQTLEGTLGDIKNGLQELRNADPQLKWELELVPADLKLYMPPLNVDTNHPFVQRLAANHLEAVGREVRFANGRPPYVFYGTDAGHLAHSARMTGVVYGPGGRYNTMPDERVNIDDIITAARVYALMVLDVCEVAV